MRTTIVILVVLLLAAPLRAVKVGDITRISGQRTNVLTGIGLVYGLKGTGDGGDFLPVIRPLAQMLSTFADSATIAELNKAQNVAVVSLTATIPKNGVRDGDRIDVYVTSWGAASSLKGGRLFVSPLLGPTGRPLPDGKPFALADGSIDLEDPSTPTTAVVHGGCVMETDLSPKYIDNGRFTLVLEEGSASWANANYIAGLINDGSDGDIGETLATALDPKNVVVNIPKAEREHPDSFISRVQGLRIERLSTEARVTINQKTGIIIMTGDVEISPVVISHKGLTISTITPPPVPTQFNPIVTEKHTVALDTTNSGGAKLQDLVNAMDALKVPAEDRIDIVMTLHKTGKLHAKLFVDDKEAD